MNAPGDDQPADRPLPVIPDGYQTVTPFVAVRDAPRFLNFLRQAFDAREQGRVLNADGTIGHAETLIGTSIVMLFESPPDWPPTPALLRLFLDRCDVTFKRALIAGAIEITRPTLMPWGDRIARVKDPFGNVWWLTERVELVAPEAVAARMSEPRFVEALAYAQSAEFF